MTSAINSLLTASCRNRPSKRWVFNPIIDLLFCCGGLFWLVVALHAFILQGAHPFSHRLPLETVVVMVGSFLLGNTHSAATLLRLYKDKGTRNRLWFQSYVSVALLVPVFIAAINDYVIMALLLRIYAVFTFDHILAQNYGLTLMYCFKAGFRPEAVEKLCLKVLYHSLTWYAILRQFCSVDFAPKEHYGFNLPLLGPLPSWLADAALWVLGASVAALIVVQIRKVVSREAGLPLPALALIGSSIAIFTQSREISGGFFIFTAAFFHAVQYLVVTTSYHLREKGIHRESASPSPEGVASMSVKATLWYWLALVALAAVLFGGLPLLLSFAGIPWQYSAAGLYICIGFHHFIADSALWKLKDAKVRANLVG